MKWTFKIPVEQFEQQPVDVGHGVRLTAKGFSEERVELDIDVEKIARVLGKKAVRSKGGRAKDLNGMVCVRHLRSK